MKPCGKCEMHLDGRKHQRWVRARTALDSAVWRASAARQKYAADSLEYAAARRDVDEKRAVCIAMLAPELVEVPRAS